MAENKCILIVSALDPSGGAGTSADIKTAKSLGFYPCPIVTAVTFQNTCGVYGMHKLDEETVTNQIKYVLEDIDVHAVKLGVGVTKEYIKIIKKNVDDERIVYDPVIKSTSGYDFFSVKECVENAKLCGSITPNVEEALKMCKYINYILKNKEQKDKLSVEEVCKTLYEYIGCNVIVTGEVDVVYNGKQSKYIKDRHTKTEVHGTGCVYSTALACYLVENDLFNAAKLARKFVSSAAEKALKVGRCMKVVNP